MVPAHTVIEEVGSNNTNDCRNQKPVSPFMPVHFRQQAANAYPEKNQGNPAVVVFFSSMKKGIGTHHKGKANHSILKRKVFDDIDAKQG